MNAPPPMPHPATARRGGGEVGAAGLTVVLAALLALAATLALPLAAADVARAGLVARAAADAGALAAAGSHPLAGGDGEIARAAAAAVAANGGYLQRCCADAAGFPPRFRVRAVASPRNPLVRALRPRVGAEAVATLRREPVRFEASAAETDATGRFATRR